ncbi:MAG: hypothetical protein E6K10_09910 [Methanobacteriota archaeon]|nr:MAG: hypothetical protein E6K10_09910 [Euryarchaeota archaeon]
MWGERAVGGFFEDLHVLIVVVLGMSILMGSLAAAYVAYQEARESTARRAEAARILRAVLDDERLVHDGQAALFDLGALERLDAAELRRAAGADPGIQLVVSEQNGDLRRTFQVSTGPLGEHRSSASTAASVWHSDLDVRAARVTVTVGV